MRVRAAKSCTSTSRDGWPKSASASRTPPAAPGRRPEDIRLIAVSKTQPIDAVRAAADAGQLDFGENKVQEALQKIAQSADSRLRWHLIGHLQSNKARKAAAAVDAIHAIDSVELLQRVDQAAAKPGGTVDVLIQVDLALEATKHGAAVDEVPAIVGRRGGARRLRLAGLMLLPPLADNPEDARPWFAAVPGAARRVGGPEASPADRLRELSMGMSHDFEVAIEEGATMVRVGTAIFGGREGQFRL